MPESGRRLGIYGILCILMLTGSALAADMSLPSPTLPLRQKAYTLLGKGQVESVPAVLAQAVELARQQENLYVRANELRYIASIWANTGNRDEARALYAEAMDYAIAIPTWNHRLYACIGVLEMQRNTGDIEGVHDNGMKAIESGLLEFVAQTGQAAETGRFFTAMNNAITEEERGRIKERILQLKNDKVEKKALHALDAVQVKPEPQPVIEKESPLLPADD